MFFSVKEFAGILGKFVEKNGLTDKIKHRLKWSREFLLLTGHKEVKTYILIVSMAPILFVSLSQKNTGLQI